MRPHTPIFDVFGALACVALTSFSQVAPRHAAVSGRDQSHCVEEATAHGPVRRCALVVTVAAWSAQPEVSLTLPVDIATVNSASVTPGDHLVVLGKSRGGDDEYAVFDVASKQLLSSSLCYFPVLSPEGRWLAYQRFVPPHGMEPLAVALELLPVDAAQTDHRPKLVYHSGPGAWVMNEPRWFQNGAMLLLGTTEDEGDRLVAVNATTLEASSLKVELPQVCLGNEISGTSGRCQLSIEQANPIGRQGDFEVTFRRFGAHGYDHKTVTYSKQQFVPIDSVHSGS